MLVAHNANLRLKDHSGRTVHDHAASYESLRTYLAAAAAGGRSLNARPAPGVVFVPLSMSLLLQILLAQSQ